MDVGDGGRGGDVDMLVTFLLVYNQRISISVFYDYSFRSLAASVGMPYKGKANEAGAVTHKSSTGQSNEYRTSTGQLNGDRPVPHKSST